MRSSVSTIKICPVVMAEDRRGTRLLLIAWTIAALVAHRNVSRTRRSVSTDTNGSRADLRHVATGPSGQHCVPAQIPTAAAVQDLLSRSADPHSGFAGARATPKHRSRR